MLLGMRDRVYTRPPSPQSSGGWQLLRRYYLAAKIVGEMCLLAKVSAIVGFF